MINPVNSDKSINTTTDKPSQSQASVKTDQVTADNASAQQTQTQESGRPTLEVDSARQLFDIENNRSEATSTVTTPQQARSLLDTIVEQFGASPESAVKAQVAHVSAPLANLLESAPA